MNDRKLVETATATACGMHLYVVGGGGCMIRNFWEYDKSRVFKYYEDKIWLINQVKVIY